MLEEWTVGRDGKAPISQLELADQAARTAGTPSPVPTYSTHRWTTQGGRQYYHYRKHMIEYIKKTRDYLHFNSDAGAAEVVDSEMKAKNCKSIKTFMEEKNKKAS